MPPTASDILESLKLDRGPGFGIATADRYLKSIEPCFDGGACPTKIFNLGSHLQWVDALKAAASVLTFSGAGMHDTDLMQKSARDGSDIAPGCVLEYDCYLTTRKKDRDLDVVEPSGLTLDQKMPVLWMHIQMQPIGKMLRVIEQTGDLVKATCALVDTELGCDAAKLVKFGALRKSIGFRPTEMVPIEVVKNSKGQDVVRGWHIKQANVFENSLVSIPANSDAEIYSFNEPAAEAFSKGLLRHPLVKSWAKREFESRPAKIQSGIDLSIKYQGRELIIKEGAADGKEAVVGGSTEDATDQNKGHGCSGGGKKKRRRRRMEEDQEEPKKTSTEADLTKAGRVLSSANQKKLEQAADLIDEVLESATGGDSDEMAAGATTESTKDCPAIANTKGLSGLVAKGSDSGCVEYRMPGSFEWLTEKLSETALSYLRAKNVAAPADGNGYASPIATFADRMVFCTHEYGKGLTACYQASWAMNNDMPEFTGDPQAVTVAPHVIEKCLRHVVDKAAELSQSKSTGELDGFDFDLTDPLELEFEQLILS